MISGILFVLEVVPETSVLVSISLTLAGFLSCFPLGSERQRPFDVRHQENRLLSADLGIPAGAGG